MTSIKEKKLKAQQEIQDAKIQKNSKIIAVLFWLASSFYIYSVDVGFSDVYSWKPFVFFVLGPIFSAIVFGNIIFYTQKIIERTLVNAFAEAQPHIIPFLMVVIIFSFFVGTFIVIFEFTKILQSLLH
jgi:hypothetical protein